MNWSDDDLDRHLREAVISERLDTTALENAIRAQIRPSNRSWYFAAAALAAVLLLTMWMRRIPVIFREAARDHKLEVVEHRPRHWQTVSSFAVDLAPAGYRLEHAKTCRLEGKPVLHLVYTDGEHEVSVYLDAQAENGDAEVDGQHITAFHAGRLRGLVVGSVAECRQVAAMIQRLT